MGDSDRCVHSESAVERVPGRGIQNVCLGDIRVVKKNAHGSGEQIVITRVLDGALWNRGRVSSEFAKVPPPVPVDTRLGIYVGWLYV